MKDRQEENFNKINFSNSEEELFENLLNISRSLGFEYCAYGLRMPLPLSNPKTIMLNNYPPAWQIRYSECNYLDVDPTVLHGIHSLQPITWSNFSFPRSHRNYNFWDEAFSFGLKFGWAQSCRDSSGIVGMLTLSRPNDPISNREIQDKIYKMVWLAQITHINMSKFIVPKITGKSRIHLTKQEINILRLTSDGMTSGEISRNLYISERTVNFHISNLMHKLHAPNKTAAAIRAAITGLLY